jgi:hypothetical protein
MIIIYIIILRNVKCYAPSIIFSALELPWYLVLPWQANISGPVNGFRVWVRVRIRVTGLGLELRVGLASGTALNNTHGIRVRVKGRVSVRYVS